MAPRKKYGTTLWGGEFLRALESLDREGRIPRGKTIANTGKVLSFDMDTEARMVAKVKGNYSPFYTVNLALVPLDQSSVDTVIRAIEERPLLLGQIRNGDLPSELLEVLKRNNLNIFPSDWSDIGGGCTCPDFVGSSQSGGKNWAYGYRPVGSPCKHMASMFYILVNELDKTPFNVFKLRGIDLQEHFALSAASVLVVPPPLLLEYSDYGKEIVDDEVDDDDDDEGNPEFFTGENETEVFEAVSISVPELEKVPGAAPFILSNLLPNPAFLNTGDFHQCLSEFYKLVPAKVDLVFKMPPLNAETRSQLSRLLGSSSITMNIGAKVKAIVGIRFTVGDMETTVGLLKETGIIQLKVEDYLVELTASDAFKLFLLIPIFPASSLSAMFIMSVAKLSWLFLREGSILPAVFPLDEQCTNWSIIWKAFDTSAAATSNTARVSSIYGDNVLFNGQYLTRRSAVDHALSAFITPCVRMFDLKKPMKPGASKVVDAFFRGSVFVPLAVSENTIAASIASYFSSFQLLNSKLQLTLHVDRSQDHSYRLTALLKLRSQVEANGINVDEFRKLHTDHSNDALSLVAAIGPFLPDVHSLVAGTSVPITGDAFEKFVTKSKQILVSLGVKLILPKELSKLLRPRLILKVVSASELGGGSDPSFAGTALSEQAMTLSWDWKVAIGDQDMSMEEFQKLVEQGSNLVQYKGSYVVLDANEIKKMLAATEKKKPSEPTIYDLLRAGLCPSLSDFSLSNALMEKVRKWLTVDETLELPCGLKATLRDYQVRGFKWMATNAANGFHSVLADDMGLGKTIQAITLLLHLKATGVVSLATPALIVMPVSLMLNWQSELHKFAPSLSCIISHGAKKITFVNPAKRVKMEGKSTSQNLSNADILIVSYGTVRSMVAQLKSIPFSTVILDESQHIKNTTTQIHKCLVTIAHSKHVKVRVALSGTPVENKLSELWAVFHLTNPGFLGTLSEFSAAYSKPIERDGDQVLAAALQNITAPFLMRRLKTDKNIAPELPEKIVVDVPIRLTSKQAILYQEIVNERLVEAQDKSSMHIFTLMLRLKQICNHPAEFDVRAADDFTLSGKMVWLNELVERIIDANEKVIIFTQFRSTLNRIVKMVKNNHFIDVLDFHGGLNPVQRNQRVRSFQQDPNFNVMVISLRAGGTGLTLTAASHVVHFDLYYNPAVENQATDRAFRIGQSKNVHVHRFICLGTIEEKINDILKKKNSLANSAVATGEKWIADLNESELQDLFAWNPASLESGADEFE